MSQSGNSLVNPSAAPVTAAQALAMYRKMVEQQQAHPENRGVNNEAGAILASMLPVIQQNSVQGGILVPAAMGANAANIQESEIIQLIILLDGSGSMWGERAAVIDGFNNGLLRDMQNDRNPDRYRTEVTLWIFAGTDAKLVFANLPLMQVQPLTEADYNPNGGTPEYKTILAAISGASLRAQDLRGGADKGFRKTTRTIFATISDGRNTLKGENDAQGQYVSYEPAKIITVVNSLLTTERWTFAYAHAGSEQEVDTYADEIGFPSRMHVTKHNRSWRNLFGIISASAKAASAAAAPAAGNGFFGANGTGSSAPAANGFFGNPTQP